MKVSNFIPGDRYSTDKRTMTNRTGAATTKGGVYFVDELWTQSESDSVEDALADVTPVTTAHIAVPGTLVVADGATADNENGLFYESYDGSLVKIWVDGTTDVLKGDALKPVDVKEYMVKASGGDLYYAVALEGQTTASIVVADKILIWCRLFSRPLLMHT